MNTELTIFLQLEKQTHTGINKFGLGFGFIYSSISFTVFLLSHHHYTCKTGLAGKGF